MEGIAKLMSGHPLRLVFLGSDAIALPLLDWLAANGALVRLVGVLTQPDRPHGRGQASAPNAVKAWANSAGIPVLQPAKLGGDSVAALRAWQPDLSLVMAYGHILKDDFIAVPRLGTVNFHASVLPQYRGASPIQTAIACGERETGVSLMRIVRELDAGPVADVERVGIHPLDTGEEIEKKLAAACVPLLERNLAKLAGGKLEFRAQDAARASFCRRLTKADGALDFQAAASVLAARINALNPWPGCGVNVRGSALKIGLAQAAQAPAASSSSLDAAEGAPPGTVLAGPAEGLPVATAMGVLEILRLQRPGGRMLPAAEFLRGFPIPPGTVLPSAEMPPLVSNAPFKH